MSNIEKIKEILEKEYNENCTNINELNEKIRTIKANNFETKLTRTFAFSMIPWAATVLLSPAIINLGIIPINLISLLSIGVPTLIGITGEMLLTKKLKYKEKLESFSESKSQNEIIEESTRYEIEREKLRSSNKVLKKAFDNLEPEQYLFNSLSENDSKSFEKLNIENIDEILEKNKKEIDIITTKKFLKEKFWRIRDRFQKVIDFIVISILGGIGFMTLYNTPTIAINLRNSIQLQTSILGIILPLGIGGLVCGGYYLKRIKDYTYAFRNVNQELGQEALSDSEIINKIYNNDIENLDIELENLINDTCDVKLQLESKRQNLANDILVSDKEQLVEEELPIAVIDKYGESYGNLLESPLMQEEQGLRLAKTKNPQKGKSNN